MLNRFVNITKPLRARISLHNVARAMTTSGNPLFAQINNNKNNSQYKNTTGQSRHYMADASTIIPDEIEKFGKMAERWWDPTGTSPIHSALYNALIINIFYEPFYFEFSTELT
jgi:hypothetical protein